MNGKESIDFGDIKLFPANKFNKYNIKSIEDAERLNKVIENRIASYRLDAILIKIHRSFQNGKSLKDIMLEEERLNLNFIAGLLTKYSIMNCYQSHGWYPIFDEEYKSLTQMVIEYALYDPEFEKEKQIMEGNQERYISLILRKIGSQAIWNISLHNLLGRTLFLFDKLVEKKEVPELIYNIIKNDFEKQFGISFQDFLLMGFLTFAGAIKHGKIDKQYFKTANEDRIYIPHSSIQDKFLETISCNPREYKEECQKNEKGEDSLRAYKFNPLFKYPLIKMRYDEYLIPVPKLVFYRCTYGIYYQLFDVYKEKFSKALGELFEYYVGIIFNWYKLKGQIISEKEIDELLPKYKGKKPDWVIICEEGIILIECKATRYSQDMYEHGLNASYKGGIDQIKKGIVQLNNFVDNIPELLKSIGLSDHNNDYQKIIISYEIILGLNEGIFKEWIDRELDLKQEETDWKIIPLLLLEEVQPYIEKGINIWSFFKEIDNKPIDIIIQEMQSHTGAKYTDSILSKIETEFYNKLAPLEKE